MKYDKSWVFTFIISFSRHHISELFLECAYETVFGIDNSKNYEEFKNFKDHTWSTLDLTKFDNMRLDSEWMRAQSISILEFCKQVEHLPRDDYLEFLHLIQIILPGGIHQDFRVSFKKPGFYLDLFMKKFV